MRRNHNAAAEAVDQEKKAPATHQDTTHTRSKQNQHANCLRHCIKPQYKGPACRKDYEALTADASKRMPTPRSNPISPCSKPRYKGPTCRNDCEALAADASKRIPMPRSNTISPCSVPHTRDQHAITIARRWQQTLASVYQRLAAI